MSDDLRHELMDRVHIASAHLQMAVEDHPALTPEWNQMYEEAVNKLESLYQAIGQSLA